MLTKPGYAGDAIPAIKELQGFQVSLVAGALANAVVAVPGMKGTAEIVSALNNNAGTLTDVTDTITVSPGKASGTLTLDTVVEDEDATVHDVVFTFKDSPAAAYTEVQVGASDTESAANLAAAINAYFGQPGSNYLGVVAESDAAVVTVTARNPGTASNAIALAGSAQVTASAATLENGADSAGVASSGATDQLVLFWYNK
jgi:hypothetical protein